MDDGVSVAERAGRETKAVWDPCEACGAKRRLTKGLCYACTPDPLKVELVELRKNNADLRESIDILQEGLARRLKNDKSTDGHSLVAHLQVKMKDLQRTMRQQIVDGDMERQKLVGLEAANRRQLSRIKILSRELRPFREVGNVDRLLPMSESDYLLLVSILIDVVEEDQTFETLALHRKLRDLPKNQHVHDV